ncbi:nucleotide-binding protein (plasmid) [Rhodococcus pyridinivorans]|uniref:nucleotide-binding protein n=1 Tax=Rhodococcus pyridinivorans TaxID=103816 RepID=UPI002164ED93|nr:nucleotide-binding protein [Rhodococcus pyridinivorans]UVT27707.1 nucleotide-binding protein [Rhodococcus pyridinivorans]
MTTPSPDPRKVFVIHGRNGTARNQIFAFLRALGLSPIEWDQAVHETGEGAPYIGQVLDKAFEIAQAIVVLETPDDVAYLRTDLADDGDPETSPQAQPRPNVLFEAGMAMGRNPKRTIIVEFGRIKQFSDIHGRHTIRLDGSPEKRHTFRSRLITAGCAVDQTGTDWLSSELTPPGAPGGGVPLGRRVPTPERPTRPRFTATHFRRGGNKLDYVEITNIGPGDALDVDVEELGATGRGLLRDGEPLPIPKLPAGKSFRLDYMGNIAMGDNKRYFTLLIKGRTADGDPFNCEEFVSMT